MSFQQTLKALGDATRREILQLLKKERMTAGEIGAHFEMTGATISHHLSVLKDASLVSDEKVGKFIYYEINTTVIDEILSWATELKGDNKNEKE